MKKVSKTNSSKVAKEVSMKVYVLSVVASLVVGYLSYGLVRDFMVNYIAEPVSINAVTTGKDGGTKKSCGWMKPVFCGSGKCSPRYECWNR